MGTGKESSADNEQRLFAVSDPDELQDAVEHHPSTGKIRPLGKPSSDDHDPTDESPFEEDAAVADPREDTPTIPSRKTREQMGRAALQVVRSQLAPSPTDRIIAEREAARERERAERMARLKQLSPPRTAPPSPGIAK